MSDYIKKPRTVVVISAFICVITLLSIFLHRPIRITDALSNLPAEGYDVHVSFWRIIFEPLFGFLLFYLRANQPLVEFLVLLLWLAAGMLVARLLQLRRVRKNQRADAALKGVLRWLACLPIILTVWVTFLLIMIFGPLPANTIKKQNPDEILVNVHSHTHFSHDGVISPTALMRWHARNGFDAFFLTEHNNHDKTLEMIQAQQAGILPPEPMVLCGEEYSGSNHILLLGLTRNFNTKDMADSTAIDSAHAQTGVAIVAHWFAEMKHPMEQYIASGADGFEIVNQAEVRYYGPEVLRFIAETCKRNRLLMVGACDYHGYGAACLTWNALAIPDWKRMDYAQKYQSILDVLRQRDQRKIKVLVYDDRRPVDGRWLLFSPVSTFIAYFRGIDILQFASWISWILIFWYLGSLTPFYELKDYAQRHYYRALGAIGLPGAGWIVLVGIWLLFRSFSVRGYNEILAEYGTDFLVGGSIFLIYSLLLLLVPRIRREAT
jgi:hypothetical protein